MPSFQASNFQNVVEQAAPNRLKDYLVAIKAKQDPCQIAELGYLYCAVYAARQMGVCILVPTSSRTGVSRQIYERHRLEVS